MELGLSQHQAIKQIQTLSPQMYMSMEILCLNSMDLQERVETELENNETLERQEEAAADGGDDAAATQTESPATEDADAPGEVAEDPLGSLEERMERADRYYDDDAPHGRSASSYRGERDEKLEAMSNTAERSISLQDYLEDQVHMLSDEEVLETMRLVQARGDDSAGMGEASVAGATEVDSNRTEESPAEGHSQQLDFSDEQV